MARYSEEMLDIITQSYEHYTAEQIYSVMKNRGDKIVLATVYNNLNKLTDSGAIRRITVKGSPDHYDKIRRHDHLVCSKCGKLADFYLDDITRELKKATGVDIDGYDLKMFYVCGECKTKQRGCKDN